jgi:hypothetical protein
MSESHFPGAVNVNQALVEKTLPNLLTDWLMVFEEISERRIAVGVLDVLQSFEMGAYHRCGLHVDFPSGPVSKASQ